MTRKKKNGKKNVRIEVNRNSRINSKVWDYVGIIAIIVIIVSLALIGMKLTGRAIDTGVVNVTIETSVSINFTDDFINFGSGQVNSGQSFATLESNSTTSTNGNWTWVADNFTIENNGNMNVSLMIKTGKNAGLFIGGVNPQYNYSVSDNEPGSCNATGEETSSLGNWHPVNTTGDGTLICAPLFASDGADSVDINIRLVIPSISRTGQLTDTLTATAETM